MESKSKNQKAHSANSAKAPGKKTLKPLSLTVARGMLAGIFRLEKKPWR